MDRAGGKAIEAKLKRLNNHKMNPRQLLAFAAWYKSGLESKTGKRSYLRAAEVAGGMCTATVYRWGKVYDWEAKAAEKDREIEERIERELVVSVVGEYNKALKRQQLFMRHVWKNLFDNIKEVDFTPDQIIKIMEYELSLYRERSETTNQDKAPVIELHNVIHNISGEARNEILERLGDEAERNYRP